MLNSLVQWCWKLHKRTLRPSCSPESVMNGCCKRGNSFRSDVKKFSFLTFSLTSIIIIVSEKTICVVVSFLTFYFAHVHEHLLFSPSLYSIFMLALFLIHLPPGFQLKKAKLVRWKTFSFLTISFCCFEVEESQWKKVERVKSKTMASS